MMISLRQRNWLVLVLLALLLLSLSACGQALAAIAAESVAAQEPLPGEDGPGSGAEQSNSPQYVTEMEIVVRSGADPDTSPTTKCSDVAAADCTLRRAIVQANAAKAGQRDVAILFEIPKSDSSYNSNLHAWVIRPLAGSGTAVFPALVGGQIFIDATSQEGDGERDYDQSIILVGPGAGDKDGFIIGAGNSGADNENGITGFAFQNFRNHIVVNSSDNLIDFNWFGLTADGLGVALRGGDAKNGSGEIGVKMAEGVRGTVVEGNTLAGFSDVAIAVNGLENEVLDNFIGTNAEGEVPGVGAGAVAGCSKGDWPGGGGMSIAGNGNYIEANSLVGLRQENNGASQPDAISITGSNHLIIDNVIGQDDPQHAVGVCGRGINLTGGPVGVRIEGNLIFNSGASAISLNGAGYDANDLTSDISEDPTGNLIWRASAWTGGETAVQLGATLPAALRNFQPAAVAEIDGLNVKGTSGAGSPCPNCKIEIFLDDRDNVVETLESLAIVKANASGDWSFKLPRPLAQNEGLRTMSTTAAKNTIPGMSAGTSTGLSNLYAAEFEGNAIYLPVVRRK